MAPGKHHVVEDKEKHKIIPKVLEGSALITTDWRDVPNRSKALFWSPEPSSPPQTMQVPRTKHSHQDSTALITNRKHLIVVNKWGFE